jgi:CopA family copper-resistance protein
VLDGTAAPIDLRIGRTPLRVGGRRASAVTINGTVPGPLLRFREGGEAVIRVTDTLDEDTSIHWHGLILPMEMDGVPGVSFPGIRPGETFEYRYPLEQYGTYWYHSHSGLQEQLGHYGPLIIDPLEPEPFEYDREYIIVLSDWTFENPYKLLAKLKKQPDYYNFQKRTVGDFFADVSEDGLGETLRNRMSWGRMRMNPTDISDITGATYTYLMNGLAPDSNWTGLFRPGERVRLRFINAGAGTFYDVRIPGLPMTVVEVSGQHVQPVETDEFRMGLAETYDVIVEPAEDRAYTIFAESMDRSGYARGTLAPREGMAGPIPPQRERPLLTMADMGMLHSNMAGDDMEMGEMPGMDHAGMDHAGMEHGAAEKPISGEDTGTPGASKGSMQGHEGHAMPAVAEAARENLPKLARDGVVRTTGLRPPGTLPEPVMHEPDDLHGPGNAAVPMLTRSRLDEPGVGLGNDGRRVLVYTQLRALHARPDTLRPPDREIEMHMTGNMERYMWSINGKKFSEVPPIHFNYGERLRMTMVNDTMMHHPMHLHGMWMELENGQGEHIPRVHTINLKPAERLSLLVTADAPGRWAFHCHILYHMDVGMFRVVEVSQPGESQPMPMHQMMQHDMDGVPAMEHGGAERGTGSARSRQPAGVPHV